MVLNLFVQAFDLNNFTVNQLYYDAYLPSNLTYYYSGVCSYNAFASSYISVSSCWRHICYKKYLLYHNRQILWFWLKLVINELFGILCLTKSCTFFLYLFLLSTFRILFRGIRDGSPSLFLLRFKVSFKTSPFSKLIELCKLYSEHVVQISSLTSIAVQFLDPVIKDSEGFCVPLRTLKIVPFWCTLLLTRMA